jgi:hypothetical protein
LWLDNNSQHPQAYWLLAPLVAGAPADTDLRGRALLWLDNNPQHPQEYQLLAPLVAGTPTDVDIRGRALAWLENNPQHPQIVEMLRVLVASAPADVESRGRAVAWLDSNSQHPQIAQLLAVMIARSPDDQAEEWIRKGIDYIQVPERNNCAAIVAATLIRSKARHDLIDQTLALAALPALKRQRGFILINLARACTYNPSSALKYITSCPDQQRRHQVTLAIAKGVLRYAVRLPDLVAALEGYLPVIVFAVLAQCLRVGIRTPEFSTYLAKSLNRGFRKPGYGAILRRLHDYPAVWKSVEPEVNSVIKGDFARASNTAVQ